MTAVDLKAIIREVPDFPKPGISFKDITTLLKDGRAWRRAVEEMEALCRDLEFEVVVGPEARGFIVGATLAYRLGVGFVPVRKRGKLPAATLQGSYKLEYGEDVLEIHRDAVRPGQKVLVVDDVLATGGTVLATIELVKKLGGEIVSTVFLVELTFLDAREKLAPHEVRSVIKY